MANETGVRPCSAAISASLRISCRIAAYRLHASAESISRFRRSWMMRESCSDSFSKNAGFASKPSFICARIACSMIDALASSCGSAAIFWSKSWSSIDTGRISSRTWALMRSSTNRFTLAPISVQSTSAFSRRKWART